MPDAMTVLPDGSAFFTGSLPLPADHWLYAPPCAEWDNERDTSADTPRPILDNSQRHAVIAAMRYAIRGATMCGRELDFDPDALALNAVCALCGPAPRTVLGAAVPDAPVPTAELGPLPPQRAGQPRMMTIIDAAEADETGHWFSPDAVQERIGAAVAAERERCAKIVEDYNPGGSYHIRTALAAEIRGAADAT